MYIICLWGGISANAQAQPDRFIEIMKQKRPEIEKVKKEFITERINLTAEQEAKFWPIYDNYMQKRLQIKMNMRKIRKEGFSISDSDEDLLKALDQLMAHRQKEIDLDKEMRAKLLEVISVRQYAELVLSEQKFIATLIQTIRGRRRGPGVKPGNENK